MKKEIHISASQITKYQSCPRQWGWQYIAGIPQGRSRALELGVRVHDILEAFYKKGTPPNLDEVWRFNPGEKEFYPGEIASVMIHPSIPRRPKWVEETFNVSLDGVNYTGKIDIAYPVNNRLIIRDHKTSSDPAKWGKNGEDLPNDVQNVMYSYLGILHLMREASEVHFGLNYGCTDAKPRKTRLVLGEPSCIEFAEKLFYSNIHPTALEMVAHRKAETNPLDLPFNPAICDMFGGCQHKGRCNLDSADRIKALVMGGSLIDRAKAMGAKKTEKKTEVPPIGPPETVEWNNKPAADQKKAEPVIADQKKAEPKKTTPKKKPAVAIIPPEKEVPVMPSLDVVGAAMAAAELGGMAFTEVSGRNDLAAEKRALELIEKVTAYFKAVG